MYLDDAVDTCGEEFVCIADDSETLEDFRSVVVDCSASVKPVMLLYAASPIPSYLGIVRGWTRCLHHNTLHEFRIEEDEKLTSIGTSHLLADHDENRNKSAVAVSRDRPHLSHQIPEARAANKLTLVLKLSSDSLELGFHIGVVRGEGANLAKHCLGFFPSVLFGEPAGRLVGQEHADDEQHCWEGLHGKGDCVLGYSGDVKFATVVDPECQHDTDRDHELVQAGQGASNSSRGILRGIERVDHRRRADTKASKHTKESVGA